jgi:hypothetical protein
MNHPADRRIDGPQLVELLRRAARLQMQAEIAEGSVSLVEAARIAAEAGIDTRYVADANRVLRREAAHGTRALLGPPGELSVEHAVPGELGSDEAVRLIADLQAAVPVAGGTIEQPAPGLWRLAGGSSALLQVQVVAGEVRVAVVSDRRRTKVRIVGGGGVLGGVLGWLASGSVMVAQSSVEAMAVAVSVGLVAGSLLGVAGGRAAWSSLARRWCDNVERVLSRVHDRVPSLSSSAEDG